MTIRRLVSGMAALATVAFAVALGTTGASTAAPSTEAAAPPTAVAVIKDASGATLGTFTAIQVNATTVQLAVSLNRLPAGFHGFHIHQTGICDGTAVDANGNPAPFATAGGHFNPAAAPHGQHAGDMPALLVVSGGTAIATARTDRFTVNSLFDADGSAVIVHSGPDNLANIPTRYSAAGVPGPDAATLATGDSGGRTGCGVLVRR
jgi:superoxide dismutase, Cu-Zn family